MKRRMNIVLSLFVTLAMVLTMSVSAFAAGIISSNTALNTALKNAGQKKSQVRNIDVEYDKKHGVYEVEFTKRSNGKEFDYEISGSSGKIVKKAIEYKYKRNSSHKKIGKKAARQKVAKFTGISYKIICKGTCTYEYDDGEGTYEIKFKDGGRKYDFDLLAPNGKIKEYEWKVIGK